jgi:flagellar M-ring protein FliF
MPAGAGIPPEQAAAIRFLVASAVAGLAPENVTIVDARAGRVISGEDATAAQSGDLLAEELRRRAERMLEARVGPGNAIVEVAIETVTESEQIVERRLDPESRVLISTEVEERATASTGASPSNVTVASNLPDGDAGAGAGQSTSDDSETRERSNFDVSETTREILRVPGGVQRLTVAVLVNEPAAPPEGGEAARAEEELTALRDLVASAVGLNEERGDVITLRAMPFSLSELDEGTSVGLAEQLLAGLDIMRLLQIAILAIVALVLGLFVVRPILTRPLPPVAEFPRLAGAGAAGPAALPPITRAGTPDATQRLVRAMSANQSEAADVLRGWIRAGEGGA